VKLLITVTAYPLPSRSYDELVCTAGITENGEWVRIYPVPFKFLNFRKYQWVDLSLYKRKNDFRPESYSPKNINLEDLKILESVDTSNYWSKRKEYCLSNVYHSLNKLIEDSKNPSNISLATFKPTKILDLIIEKDTRDWKRVWKQARKQFDLFKTEKENTEAYDSMIKKIPYKFKYKFEDQEGVISTMMIEDWEIGALYWKCLNDAAGDEETALKKVKQKYFDIFTNKHEIYLFLGTTLQFHQRRARNPFVIIGVFYPLRDNQLKLI